MPNALAFIGGGLLEGIGKGLAEQARETGVAKRERVLADLEHKRALERDEARLEGRRGLLGERLESDRDLAGQREAGAGTRTAATITAAGERRTEASRSAESVARITAASRKTVAEIAAGKPSKATDTTVAEDRIIERHVQMDENGIETVDHEAAAVALEERGFKKAAAAQRRKDKGIADLDIRRIAEAQADAEVDEKAHPLVPDSVDFKEDGGSRIRFRARRVREIMAELEAKPAATQPAAKLPTRPEETQPVAPPGEPYTGAIQPPGFPNARRSSRDGFWYIPDPARPDKFKRVNR